METNSALTEVDILQLKRLLYELKDHGNGICIRLRMLGELWQTYHSKIVTINEFGAVLLEDATNKLVFIQELNNIIQFELDKPFQNYRPHFHYTVTIS